MRFMIIRRADAGTESGEMRSQAVLSAMGACTQAMIEAGVFRVGEGLHPTFSGARVRVRGGAQTVTDGPFAETKEVIAGCTMIEVGSRAEALEWVWRWPEPDVELELRQVFEPADLVANPQAPQAEWRVRGSERDHAAARTSG